MVESVIVPSAPMRSSPAALARACSMAGAMALRNSSAAAANGCVPCAMGACCAGVRRLAFSPQTRNDP